MPNIFRKNEYIHDAVNYLKKNFGFIMKQNAVNLNKNDDLARSKNLKKNTNWIGLT